MKIKSVEIKNFRSFKEEKVDFDNYTCFVGANGAGKSTILNALNIFFRQTRDSKTDLNKLTIQDFHHKDTSNPIEITVTFKDLSDEAKEELSDYVRQDKLVVTAKAEFDQKTEVAEIKQYGNRKVIKDFSKYFESDKKKALATELKEIYADIRKDYPELPEEKQKAKMEQALRNYEENNPDQTELLQSEDQFYGFTKGSNKLSKFIQWVFIPASKDFIEESEETKNSSLGQLLARTVRGKVNFSEKILDLKKKTQDEYEQILNNEQPLLTEISESIKKRLENWAHPGVDAKIVWKQDSDKSIRVEEPFASLEVGERGFTGDLARFGHGLQRSYMLALLQELSLQSDSTLPLLVMAIEEPELYQHPPQIRHLSEVLFDLSQNDSQVIICSHHPLFIPGDQFESVRIVKEEGKPSKSSVSQVTYQDLNNLLSQNGQKNIQEKGMMAKIYPILNPVINEMFFCRVPVITEGIEDVAYISAYLHLTGHILDFRNYGCHLIPVSGKSTIIKPLAIANLLQLPAFVVCDADTHNEKIPNEQRRIEIISKHKNDNRTILNLSGNSSESEWPTKNIIKDNLVMWKTEMTKVIPEELEDGWKNYLNNAYQFYGAPGGLEKNPLAIARALEEAWNDGVKSKILIELVEKIISFAKNSAH